MTQYNDYVAAVEFDDSVGRLHGRVVNSGAYPIATFEADPRRRHPARVPAVDRRVPRVVSRRRSRAEEASGTLNLRLGPDLHQRAVLSATAHGVSLNSWIKQAVEEKASR